MPPLDNVTIKSCRICLNTQYSDYVSFDDGGGWLKMYEFCFGLHLTIQDMPRILCDDCKKKMVEFSNFKLQSHKSDKLWKTIVNIPSSVLSKKKGNEPSLQNIKQEYEEVFYVDSSDAEAEDKYSKPFINEPIKKGENPDCDYDDDDYFIDNSNAVELGDVPTDKKNKNKKIYTCEKCKMEYKILKFYKKHIRKNNCNLTELNAPKSSKNTQELYCGLCEMRSLDPEEIKAHLNEHSAKDDLSCKLCEFVGRDFADMETHRYSHQPDRTKTFLCHICDKRHNVILALQFHFRTVHLKKEKGGVCTVCSKEYRRYKMWRNHERWHRAAKFTCAHCDRKFLFRNAIISHLKDHDDKKSFICDMCGRGFKRYRNLTGHIRTVHDYTKVTCTHCDKVFKNQACLEVHMRLEAKEKLYQCDVCSKCYHSTSKMRKHMVWHANDRPFACQLCESAYKCNAQLKIHMRKHTGFFPYKCPMCPREFATSKQLKVHSSVHSGVRHYKCPYCVRSFHNKKDLVLHCDKVHQVTDFKITVPKKEI